MKKTQSLSHLDYLPEYDVIEIFCKNAKNYKSEYVVQNLVLMTQKANNLLTKVNLELNENDNYHYMDLSTRLYERLIDLSYIKIRILRRKITVKKLLALELIFSKIFLEYKDKNYSPQQLFGNYEPRFEWTRPTIASSNKVMLHEVFHAGRYCFMKENVTGTFSTDLQKK